MGGENERLDRGSVCLVGSSPRGRGKRLRDLQALPVIGLIPAWAGKTPWTASLSIWQPAHPRVGGENPPTAPRPARRLGSSPRGRGKLAHHGPAHGRDRLIPAWAGKTDSAPASRPFSWAHPRVGGENIECRPECDADDGSSPRGRGKQGELAGTTVGGGLIPAWAGKTRPRRPT